MNPDKKQVPQLIVLGVLVVAFAAYAAFQFMGSKRSPKTQAKSGPAHRRTESAAGTGAGPGGYVVQQMGPGTTALSGARRDPFTPQRIPGAWIMPPQVVRPPTSRPRAAGTGLGPLGRKGVPPINPFDNDGPGGGTKTRSGGATVSAQPITHPDFNLTGILCGDRNVAIIRVGEERHIVSEGQTIKGDYKVAQVNKDEVALVHSSSKSVIRVKLGGVKNAN